MKIMPVDEVKRVLEAEGLKLVRILEEDDGYVFCLCRVKHKREKIEVAIQDGVVIIAPT